MLRLRYPLRIILATKQHKPLNSLPKQNSSRCYVNYFSSYSSSSPFKLNVPGYGKRNNPSIKKNNETQNDRQSFEEKLNFCPQEFDVANNQAKVIDNFLESGDGKSARLALQRWMHGLYRDLEKACKSSDDKSSTKSINEATERCLAGLKYMIGLLEREGSVERYERHLSCIINRDDALMKLSEIPLTTIVNGLLATNHNVVTLEIVETCHKLTSFFMNSLPNHQTQSKNDPSVKAMYDRGISVVPSYWVVLHTTESYVHILDDISMREERLERVSTLKEIASCWNGIDRALTDFLDAHYYYSEVLRDVGKAYEYRGRRAHVRNQFRVITNNGLKAMYRTMVDANRSLAFELAHKWMKNFQELTRSYSIEGPDINTFTPLISICGRAFELEKAQEWFEFMVAQDIIPDTFIYNVLMDAYANSLHNHANNIQGGIPRPDVNAQDAIAKVEKLFDELQNSKFCQPDADSYKIYIKALSRIENDAYAYRAELLAKELLQLQDAGVLKQFGGMGDKEDYLHNAMIYAWAKNTTDVSLDKAKWWFHAAEQESIATAVTYNTMMHAYSNNENISRNDCIEAENIFFRMVERGINPSNTSFSSLMSIWSKLGNEEGTDKVLEWFERHQENSLIDPASNLTNREFNITLISISKLRNIDGALVNKAREIYRKMKNSSNTDIRPTTVTFGSMIKILSKSPLRNSWREAVSLLEDCIKNPREDEGFNLDGAKPSGHAFSSIFNAMSNASPHNPQVAISADKLMSLFEEIKDEYNLSLHPSITQNLIRVFSRSKHSDSGILAEKWLHRSLPLLHDRKNMTSSDEVRMQQIYRMAIEAWIPSKQKRDTLYQAESLFQSAPNIVKENPYVLMGIAKVASLNKSPDSLAKTKLFVANMRDKVYKSERYGRNDEKYFDHIGRFTLMTACANSEESCFDLATEIFNEQSKCGDLQEGLILRYIQCIKNFSMIESSLDEHIKRVFHVAVDQKQLTNPVLSSIRSIASEELLVSLNILSEVISDGQKIPSDRKNRGGNE